MNANITTEMDIDTTKPSSIYTPRGPRPQTLSVALPVSLLHNSKRKLDLRTSLAGSVSRALAVFCVDEVIIYDDGDGSPEEAASPITNTSTSSKLTAFTHPGHFLRLILAYQETPPFMRSRLFPVCEDLKGAGILPSLDIPSHLRAGESCEFREGIVVRNGTAQKGTEGGTYVDCGLAKPRFIRGVSIPLKTRVTLRLSETVSRDLEQDDNLEADAEAEAVAPDVPRSEKGYYWGYTVREAAGLSAVFTEAAYDGGYDLSVGTSERGVNVAEAVTEIKALKELDGHEWRHMLVVFGGVKGLEEAVTADAELKRLGVNRASVASLFDYWVNMLPGQGSRTIRTEEALWMGLMALKGVVDGC